MLKSRLHNSSECTLVKMPCWKSHVTAHFMYMNVVPEERVLES